MAQFFLLELPTILYHIHSCFSLRQTYVSYVRGFYVDDIFRVISTFSSIFPNALNWEDLSSPVRGVPCGDGDTRNKI